MPDRRGTGGDAKRRLGLGRVVVEHGAAWVSAVTGLITLFVATGFGIAYGTRTVQVPKTTRTSVTSTVTTTAARPAPVTPTGSAAATGPACALGNAAFAVLTPKDQSGYLARWHGCMTIDSAGVDFGNDRPT